MNKKIGFTLAEVLITLAIIGIVASMTIPNLIANNHKVEYVTGLKKAYTVFNQALAQMTANSGCVQDLKCTGVYLTTSNFTTFGDEIVKYFNVTKNCKTTDSGCFAGAVAPYIDGSGTKNTTYDTDSYRFITSDGMAFALLDDLGFNCQTGPSSTPGDNTYVVCGKLYVDVNGPKRGPNTLGRDIFHFLITNGKGAYLYPVGGAEVSSQAWKNYETDTIARCDIGAAALNGSYCAGRVMEEGWVMNY